MDYAAALSYLAGLGHETVAIKFGLEKTVRVLEALGNPQNTFRKIQVVGTNGKGSTAAFLESICCAAGVKTGTFTSPHLKCITERIRIDRREISAADFARAVEVVRKRATQLLKASEIESPPTFFEHVTLSALYAFGTKKIEIGILEAGLGGRLDSTTAAQSEVVIFTPIAMDHQEYLGDSIESIATEKAAAISHTTRHVVIGPQIPAAAAIIEKRCREFNIAPLKVEDSEFSSHSVTADGRLNVSVNGSSSGWLSATLSLRGRHQFANATTAVVAAGLLETLGFPVSTDSIKWGLENAVHPGRLEYFERKRRVLLDGAHNPAGAAALARFLDEFTPKQRTMIFGAMRDKDISEILRLMIPCASGIIFTDINNPRAANSSDLKRLAEPLFPGTEFFLANSFAEALRSAIELTPERGIIVVTGSLYLVGEACTYFSNWTGKHLSMNKKLTFDFYSGSGDKA